jgi:hypothetical protein
MYHTARVFLVLLSVALLWDLALAAEKRMGVPVIHIENSVFDFGQVPRGELVKHRFTIRNKGSAPLKIEKVQTD